MAHWRDVDAHWRDAVAHWIDVEAHWRDVEAHWRDAEAHWIDVEAHWRDVVAHWKYVVAHWRMWWLLREMWWLIGEMWWLHDYCVILDNHFKRGANVSDSRVFSLEKKSVQIINNKFESAVCPAQAIALLTFSKKVIVCAQLGPSPYSPVLRNSSYVPSSDHRLTYLF